MWPNPQETADLITFTEEILNGKLPFLWCWKIKDDKSHDDFIIYFKALESETETNLGVQFL